MEQSLIHFQNVIFKQCNIQLNQIKKIDSVGGMRGAFYLLGADMMSGIDLVMQVTEFEKHIQNADYIVTGEGSIINGRTISDIAKIAFQYNIPVIVFGGRVTEEVQNLYVTIHRELKAVKSVTQFITKFL